MNVIKGSFPKEIVKFHESLEQMLKPYQCSISSIELKNMGHILIELSQPECYGEIVVSNSHDMIFLGGFQ